MEALEAVDGEFEELGTEPIDGVDTRHLRMVNPEVTPWWPGSEDNGERLFRPVLCLDLWADDAGFVRRMDVSFGPDTIDSGDKITAGPNPSSVSMRFFDYGEPITIEAPTDAVDGGAVG